MKKNLVRYVFHIQIILRRFGNHDTSHVICNIIGNGAIVSKRPGQELDVAK